MYMSSQRNGGALGGQSGGVVQVGANVGLKCKKSAAGTIRWSPSADQLELCNGAKWQFIGTSAPAFGTVPQFVKSDAKCGKTPGLLRYVVDQKALTTTLQVCHGTLHALDKSNKWMDVHKVGHRLLLLFRFVFFQL